MALVSGDWAGAKAAIAGIGDAARDAAAGTNELFAAQRNLEALTKQQTVENAKLRQSIEAQKKILEDTTLTYEARMAALKEVNKDTEQLAKNEIALTEATLRSLQAQLALENSYEKRIELEQQIAEAQGALIDSQTALQTIQYDAAKVERELQQQRRDEQQAAYEKQLETAKAYQDQLSQLEQDSELLRIADADERAKRKLELDKENAIAALKDTEFSETQKRELIKAINLKYDAEEADRQKTVDERKKAEDEKKKADADAKAKAEQDKAAADTAKLNEILQQVGLDSIENAQLRAREELRIQEEKAMAELELLGATEEQKQKVAALYTKKREDLAKEETEFNKKLKQEEVNNALDASQDILSNIITIVGEGSAVGKAAAVASATIDTYKSATAAYSSTVGIPVVGPVLAPIAAGVAVAAGIANVNKILNTKIPGDKAVAAVKPTAAAAPAFDPTASLPTGQTTQSEGTIQQTGSTSNVIKAYVVATEMTDQQEANKKVEDLARL